MSLAISIQPLANSVNAAYRPIYFLILADQQPTGGAGPSPVVIADVYINGVYYASESVTDYVIEVILGFTYYYYSFDIQDKIQEYLNANLARMYEGTVGDIERHDLREYYSAKVSVKFRESYIDADGFTVFYGTAPVKATKFTPAVAGTGTATSNDFYVLSASLRHEENMSLEAHLQYYKDPFQATLQLSHRPNIYYPGVRIGGGNYFVTKKDHDFVFCFSMGYDSTTWLVNVSGKYRNGTTFTTPFLPYPNTTPPADWRVYSIDGGIAGLLTWIPGVDWDNVVEYDVYVFAFFFQAIQQHYIVQNNCERVRIFFRNKAGAWDGINFEYAEEQTKTQSGQYQTSLPAVMDTKAVTGINRLQPRQGETVTVQCKEYGEKDINWIKELLDTPRAYIQWDGKEGQPAGLLPIKIEDSDIKTLKNDERFEYLIILKYINPNEVISLRQ